MKINASASNNIVIQRNSFADTLFFFFNGKFRPVLIGQTIYSRVHIRAGKVLKLSNVAVINVIRHNKIWV